MKNIETLDTFDENNIPFLDTVVLGALELFSEVLVPELKIKTVNQPLVVGSGNAEAAGRIIFEGTAAIFASESTYRKIIDTVKTIDQVIVISASGAKHAPEIVKYAKENNKPTILLTNTTNSLAEKLLNVDNGDQVYKFPKNREPYTYNTSTYLGMILAQTKENPKEVLDFINSTLSAKDFSSLSEYDKFYMIIPPEFSGIIRMLQVKYIELFGRNVSNTIETSEYVQHATTVAPSNELFISFGNINTTWGKEVNRMHIPLPGNAGYAAMMMIGYYVVGQIQRRQPQYFKENIVQYTKDISNVFNQPINTIVE